MRNKGRDARRRHAVLWPYLPMAVVGLSLSALQVGLYRVSGRADDLVLGIVFAAMGLGAARACLWAFRRVALGADGGTVAGGVGR